MALQCRFTPAIIALLVADFDEEPARKDTEVFDGLDLGHFGCWEGEEKERGGKWREKFERRREDQGEEVCNRMQWLCAMTESCEWRGQIWIRLGATGAFVCR